MKHVSTDERNFGEPVRLLHLTDCHLHGDPQGRLRGVVTLEALKDTLAEASARHGDFDATLLTGDLVQDDPAGYAHIQAVFGSSRRPVHCLPGNHDDRAAMRAALAAPPFTVGGHVLAGAWLVVLLDSCIDRSANGHLAPGELARLEAALAAHPGRPALVCLHHHPVAMGSRWLDTVGLDNAPALFEILERHPQVRAVLWGHVHQAFDEMRGSVRLLSTPSTCAQFKPRADGFAIDHRPPGYRWLELHADGRLITSVEWLETGLPARAAAG
jgi:3',5'-cyclic-AMP phosphodiesterase